MKNSQKKHIKFYYGISVFMNFIIPMFVIMSAMGRVHGERQLGLFLIGVWGIFCALVYALYFTVPEFNKNWEKIAGLVLPSIILSLILFVEETLIYVVFINFILNGLFIWHFTKTSMNNN